MQSNLKIIAESVPSRTESEAGIEMKMGMGYSTRVTTKQPRSRLGLRPATGNQLYQRRSSYRPDTVLVMSSALLKGKLKAAKDALNKKDYQFAHDTSLQILEYEPDNYHAYVSQRAAITRPLR